MKSDIFENNAHPFTVPEGYFDTLQDRIMNRIQTEERFAFRVSRFGFRTLVAAAACILFIITGAALHKAYTARQPMVVQSMIDDDFYRWVYTSDRATLLAESLVIPAPESSMANKNDYFEEDDAIISFLEYDNISVVAILMVSD